MKKYHIVKHSLFTKIFIPIVLLMIFQSFIFYAATTYGGISSTLRQNAEDVLAERVSSKQNDLESKLTTQWTNFSISVNNINSIYRQFSDTDYSDTAVQKEFLKRTVSTLINMLRSNEVNGVFLILNGSKEFQALEQGQSSEKYGIGIRDYDPTSEYVGTQDLLSIRCPSSIVADVGCPLESWWEAFYTFDEHNPGDYYYKPLEEAYENPDTDITNLAYFDGNHTLGNSGKNVVSYSIPLMDDQGYPYAVLGIELTNEYLKTLISSKELYGDSSGSYALVQYDEGSTDYRVITYDGVLFQQCFGNAQEFSAKQAENGILLCENTNNGIVLCGSMEDMVIYNHNTPFESEKLALIGLVRSNNLYEVSDMVSRRLLTVSIIILLIGAIAVFIVSKRITNPVTQLSRKVKALDTNTFIPELERLNIDEIDDLVISIEDMSGKISKNAARTEFFSRMSHDMRTPMNAIIGFSSPEIMENASIETMMEYMNKIHASGGYLLAIINDVLDMTKIESERMELREEPVTRAFLIEGIEPIIREVANERGVNFVVSIDDTGIDDSSADSGKTDDGRVASPISDPADNNQTSDDGRVAPPISDPADHFLADIQRMRQIFMNLLSNAVKFTDAGGIVKLEAKRIYKDKDSITNCFIVEDNGIGMSKEFQEHMYQPFAQDASGSESKGTGLGLAIAKQLTELMGGVMLCESAPGVGTKFTLKITSKLVENVSMERGTSENDSEGNGNAEAVNLSRDGAENASINVNSAGTKAAEGKSSYEGKKILLCEDHPLNAQIAIKLLNRKGLIVEHAKNGREGLEMFEASEIGGYDMILMDIRMPEMDGLEAAGAIRALDRSDAATVPIIAMTANAFAEDVKKSAAAGMNEHLSKPIDPKILYITLAQYLGKYDK